MNNPEELVSTLKGEFSKKGLLVFLQSNLYSKYFVYPGITETNPAIDYLSVLLVSIKIGFL